MNDEKGLEQGFTIHDAVGAVARADAPAAELHLDLALSGNILAYPSEDRQSIEFRDCHGARVIRYGALFSQDARGRSLPSRMEALAPAAGDPSRVRIVVDAAGAVYPVTIDLLAIAPAWTSESDQNFAAFGGSIASAGDVNGDGYSDVIVGAYKFDNGHADEGRAFLYLGSASGLAGTPAWAADSDQDFAHFGGSVASAGDVNGDGYSDVVVGSSDFDNGETNEGRAFLYLGSAAGLAATASWTAESDQSSAAFGHSVASAGDVNGDGYSDVIVGASDFDNGEINEGRGFLYLGSATGLAPIPSWTAESDQFAAYFGWSVASAGDVNGDGYSDVIVGAPYLDNGQTDEGRAFLYLGSAAGLAVAAGWTAEGDQAYAYFGHSVASAGDVNGDGYSDVIVGAPFFDNGETNEGRSFLYLGSAASPAAAPAWTAESDQSGAVLGLSVASAGDVNGDGYSDVISAAPNFDNGQTGEGRALIYPGSAAGLAATAAWNAESDRGFSYFGTVVANAGDVNGDGYSDVVAGAPYFDNDQTGEGRAFLYLGSASGLASSYSWTAESDQFNGYLGYSVAGAGDVNGDGYSDVVVGSPTFDNGQTDEGRAFLYLGSVAGLATTPAWTAESDQDTGFLGNSVASAGDVNGDGYSDVIVAAVGFDNAHGRASLYLGSPTGLSGTPSWTVEGGQDGEGLGVSVASAGDVNGDGYSDVIVAAYSYDNVEVNEGRTYLYLGSPSGLAAAPAWTAEGDQTYSEFGISVASAGDVNGDGYSDVIVGASSFDNDQAAEGRAFLYLGSASGLAVTPAWTAESDQDLTEFGRSVASAGDVNGDGYSDVVVGAHAFTNGQLHEGRAFLYLGSASGLAAIPVWTAESDQVGGYFGYSVASAGDVNGDGYSDVIVGTPYFDNGHGNEGGASLYAGNGGFGVPLLPRQFQDDGSTPIAHLGRTNSDSFQVSARGMSPFGRGNLGLEWEAKSLSARLDGAATNRTAWSDSGTAGTPLAGWTILSPDGPYHWRARLRYHPATVLFQPASRWFSIQPGGWQQTHLRALVACLGETVPPTVVPPSAATVAQSTCAGANAGATSATSSALAAFLAGGSATDNCDSSPLALPPQVGGVDVDSSTFFPLGATTVTFRYQDALGNIGSATSTVTVTLFFGDLDEHGQINATDLVILANYLVGNASPGAPPFTAPVAAADVNTSTTVDATDLVILANFLVGNIACLPPSAGIAVGDSHEGGIVAYILQPGDPGYAAGEVHGLIAAASDQSTGAQWGCFPEVIGGTSTALGAGRANTTVIVNECGEPGIAARICNDLVLNGYDDWYLPSQDELGKVYLNRIAIGGFDSTYYWTSSEGSHDTAVMQDFGSGLLYSGYKFSTNDVRAVRAF